MHNRIYIVKENDTHSPMCVVLLSEKIFFLVVSELSTMTQMDGMGLALFDGRNSFKHKGASQQ